MAFSDADLKATLTLQNFMSGELKKTTAHVKQFASQSRASVNRLAKSFVTLGGAVSVVGAAMFARSSVQAFMTQTKAVAGMEQVMRSMGRYTPELSQEMQDLASHIQKVGISGDEATIEGTKFLMTYKQITDDLLPDTIKAMADLSALTGQDMAAAANIMGKAAMGMTGMLARYGITLSDAAKKSKDFKLILSEITAQVGGQQEALRAMTGGELYAFGNAWGDVKEKIGGAIVEGLTPYLKDLVKTITDLETGTERLGPKFSAAFEGAILIGARIADGYKIAKMAAIEFGIAAVKARVFAEEVVSFDWWEDMKIGMQVLIAGEKRTIAGIQARAQNAKEAATGFKELSNAELALIELEHIRTTNIEQSFSTYEDAVIWLEKLGKAREATAKAGEKKRDWRQDVYTADQVGIMNAAAKAARDKAEAEEDAALTQHTMLLNYEMLRDFEKEQIENTKKQVEAQKEAVAATKEYWDMHRAMSADESLSKQIDDYRAIEGAVTGIGNIIGDNIVRAIDEAQRGTLSWRKVLTQTANDLSRMLLQTALKTGISLLASGIAGGATGGGRSYGEGFYQSASPYAKGGFVSGALSIPRAQKGMRVKGRQLIEVGDNQSGEEVIMPVERGPGGVMGVRGSGGGVTLNVEFSGIPNAEGANASAMMASETIFQLVRQAMEERGLA